MESMEEKVMAEFVSLRRFIGEHFEQQNELMTSNVRRTPSGKWPFAGMNGTHRDIAVSPCDGNSHEEIPTETYQSYPGKASKEHIKAVEFTDPRDGVIVTTPEMQSVLQLGSRDSANTSDPMSTLMSSTSTTSLKSSDTFVNDFVKNFEQKALGAAEKLKQKRRSSMVTQMNKDSSARSIAKQIVQSPFFAYTVTSIITFNLVVLGIEVDVSTALGSDDIPTWFGISNLIVVILFTFEMGISLFANGISNFFCGKEKWWNIFDLAIILLSLLETILDFWASSSSNGQNVNTSQLRFVRYVRLARALRGIRVMRLLRYVSALRTLVLSIMSSMASLLWTLVLLMLLFYSFGVLFTQLVSDECRFQTIVRTDNLNAVPQCQDDFGLFWSTIPDSMLTLFMSITGGIDWETAARPLKEISIVAVMMFVIYITVTIFAIVNVITGVFVTTAMETTAADKDLMVMKQLQKRNTQVEDLKHLFADIGGGEEVSEVGIDQFKQAMMSSKFSAFLHSMGISTEDVGLLFKLLDADADGLVELEEFVHGCLNLHGAAKSSQLARMSYENKLTRREIKNMQKSLSDLHILIRMICENWSV